MGWIAVAQIPVRSSKTAWPDRPCFELSPAPRPPKRNLFVFYGFSFLPPTRNINRFGWKGPEAPILISIQLSANKAFLIINSAMTEKTVMFHGRRSEDKLLYECCNAMMGRDSSDHISGGKKSGPWDELSHKQAQGAPVLGPACTAGSSHSSESTLVQPCVPLGLSRSHVFMSLTIKGKHRRVIFFCLF